MTRSAKLGWALAAAVPLSLGLALMVGSSAVGAGDVWNGLWGRDATLAHTILYELRLPRALSAFAVGGLLALAGALLQVLLRNPLADPYILGVSGGAAVAALLSLLAGLGGIWVMGNAFAGSLVSMLLVFSLAHGRGAWSPTRMLLTGVVVAAGWGALVSLILALAPDTSVQGMLFWLMGDLEQARRPLWLLAVLALGLALAWPRARALNLLARGALTAAALGENPRRLRVLVYFLGALMTAAAVTQAGSIGFVGLVVPHLVRLLGSVDHRVLLPQAVLLGGSFLVLADTAARVALAPTQIPVGVITALLGVPVFLFLLMRQRP